MRMFAAVVASNLALVDVVAFSVALPHNHDQHLGQPTTSVQHLRKHLLCARLLLRSRWCWQCLNGAAGLMCVHAQQNIYIACAESILAL